MQLTNENSRKFHNQRTLSYTVTRMTKPSDEIGSHAIRNIEVISFTRHARYLDNSAADALSLTVMD